MSVALLAFKATMKELKASKDGDTLHVVEMRPKIYTAPPLASRIWTAAKNLLSCSCIRKRESAPEEISVKESIIRLIEAHEHEAAVEDLDGIGVCEAYLKAQTGSDVVSCLARIAKIRERLRSSIDVSASVTSSRMSGQIAGIRVTADLIDNLMKEGKYPQAAVELNRTKQDNEIKDIGKLLGVFFAKAEQDRQVLSRLDKLMQIAGDDLHCMSMHSSHFESDSISQEVLQEGMNLVLSHCKKLERISFDDKLICYAKPDFSSCSKLQSFTISLTGPHAILALWQLEINELKSLKIIIERLADVTRIPSFKILDQLTSFGIYDMRRVKELQLPFLSQIPTLQTVELNGVLLGEEHKAVFDGAPPITSIVINTISDQSLISEICNIKSLTKLSVSVTGMTYKTFHDLAKALPELTSLEVRALPGISGPELISEYMTKFPKLQYLILPHFRIKSVNEVKAVVAALSGNNQLVRISVAVTSKGVDAQLKARFKEAYPNITVETDLKS